MARTAGRQAGETKRLILAAATRLIGRHGTGVPLADIAEAAGVSKGGLLYHFPNKEELLNGLATDLMDRFRHDVEQAATEEAEGTPGRLTRAYIRVSFEHGGDDVELREHIALAVHLMFEPGLEELAQRDAQRWRTALLDDGLDQTISRMIIAATDGTNSAPLWGAVLSDADHVALQADLIALTHGRFPGLPGD
ncbi:TetR/AcrR family transcriptional regulator [Actinoalloteichus hymeniacidonis]|uniref:Transcriptional regulator, TetR family n=1 Tax=Actinoalloteichus hymeniacidonis TaxID=340345 RepID=A0AAC9MXL4_9PSEU|nr:TetR/AcrR family transcriptional regulator [Actinoalloteichus hymeniacidonis]AOS62027.1 transcriptional regulator, TetR family [Actinoalloteichus hymeniacidonis]MBB5909951.1 AcrR family transcriptional regulator [Actinoalloteichus hymeniacidonis]